MDNPTLVRPPAPRVWREHGDRFGQNVQCGDFREISIALLERKRRISPPLISQDFPGRSDRFDRRLKYSKFHSDAAFAPMPWNCRSRGAPILQNRDLTFQDHRQTHAHCRQYRRGHCQIKTNYFAQTPEPFFAVIDFRVFLDRSAPFDRYLK
jgi:hypothetical protein